VFNRVLVPVDRSPFAEKAIPFAIAIARRSGARIHFVLVHEGYWPDAVTQSAIGIEAGFDSVIVREEQEYVEALARAAGADHDVCASATVLEGPVAATLARYTRDANIDLVVMSTHGHGGIKRAWLGSVADRLVRRLRVPVLLVRPVDSLEPAHPPDDFHNVLIALDGSEVAEHALATATELPFAPGARCTLLRVAPVSLTTGSSFLPDTARDNNQLIEERTRVAGQYLETVLEMAGAYWETVNRHVVAASRIADAILDEADSTRADLVVVGTRGRTHLGRAVIGSVADKVIRGAAIPVLVYPARALDGPVSKPRPEALAAVD
jgi:nucleotide-binding universal stress UspA family protein